MFLDYHNILWYYHQVIVFCATPIQAFQSVSEPHTLLSLYFSQQHHYAAEQWAVDFFVFEGTFSPAARMTPAMPSAGASIREDQDVILAFFIYPNAVRLWNIFERWHPHEQKELSRQTLVSVSRRRPAQAETQENGAEGGKIPPQLYPRCTPSDGAAEGIDMAVASESYAPSVLVSTEGLPEKDWLRLLETGYDGRLYQVKAEETENLPDTFSIENAYFSSPESLLIFLEDLIRGQYGNIFRAKGQILAGSQWFQFDVADSRYGITGCEPQKTGKAVFIGTEIHRQPIRRVVLSKMIQKKIVVKKR